MGINETDSVTASDGGGRDAVGGTSDTRDTCSGCDGIFAALDKHGIAYEVIAACNWCKANPANSDPEMEGCCSEDCRYMLACDEGFVTDAEHEQNVAEGWAS